MSRSGVPLEAEGVADAVLEEALVAEVDVCRVAREEHERGRLDGRLRGVEEAWAGGPSRAWADGAPPRPTGPG